MTWLRGNEKGFTLIELLVAIPIIGLIGVAAAGVIIQLVNSNQVSQRNTAAVQVQSVGTSISQDGMQAQRVTFGSNLSDPNWALIMNWDSGWTDSSGTYRSRSATITYRLVPMAGNLYKLERRAVIVNTVGTTSTTSDVTTTVAQYLDVSRMSCQWQSGPAKVFEFKVVATVGAKTEERTYRVSPRAAG